MSVLTYEEWKNTPGDMSIPDTHEAKRSDMTVLYHIARRQDHGDKKEIPIKKWALRMIIAFMDAENGKAFQDFVYENIDESKYLAKAYNHICDALDEEDKAA